MENCYGKLSRNATLKKNTHTTFSYLAKSEAEETQWYHFIYGKM